MTPDLSPEANIKRISSAAYDRLANIRNAFRNLCKESFTTLFTTYIRPIMEYAAPAWSPYLVKHKTKLEKVQRSAVKYEIRRETTGTEPHVARRKKLGGDMITTYKILRKIDKLDKDNLRQEVPA
ncbi:uncharacterized protein [Procambarus clarkii]|uniref:uncharacterized protein n=1 Tax=Procambarus clarkii TaxID=6728 RepID=UPI0037420F5D